MTSAPPRTLISPDEIAFVRWPLARSLRESGFDDIDVEPFDFLYPLTPKPLIGAVGLAILAGVMLTPIATEATLVDRTVYCEEFGFIT